MYIADKKKLQYLIGRSSSTGSDRTLFFFLRNGSDRTLEWIISKFDPSGIYKELCGHTTQKIQSMWHWQNQVVKERTISEVYTLPLFDFVVLFYGDVIKVINNHHHLHHHEVQLPPNINYCQTSSLGCRAS